MDHLKALSKYPVEDLSNDWWDKIATMCVLLKHYRVATNILIAAAEKVQITDSELSDEIKEIVDTDKEGEYEQRHTRPAKHNSKRQRTKKQEAAKEDEPQPIPEDIDDEPESTGMETSEDDDPEDTDEDIVQINDDVDGKYKYIAWVTNTEEGLTIRTHLYIGIPTGITKFHIGIIDAISRDGINGDNGLIIRAIQKMFSDARKVTTESDGQITLLTAMTPKNRDQWDIINQYRIQQACMAILLPLGPQFIPEPDAVY